jgi:anti-sigma factor ChrR (cupin superfamily)
MRLRADFSRQEVVRPEDYAWQASPASGVDRMMLDRIGDEVARATTIVRFAPNSQFDSHTHGGGEEYLVLDGVFSDEHGDYTAGTYVRNPIGTEHRPHIGPEGATILVKLCQFEAADQAQKTIDTAGMTFAQGSAPGVTELLLHHVTTETVRLVRFAPGVRLDSHAHPAGEELFVLEGSFGDEAGHYSKGTWVRSPAGSSHAPYSDEGCLLWIKTGHLPNPATPH